MRERDQYLNIKSSYVKIIFIVMLVVILISMGLTIMLYGFFGQYIDGRLIITKRLIFGANTGILTALFITIVVLLPIISFASKKMGSPFIEMQKVAVAMSEGDFTIRAKDNYTGEMGQLAVTLNQLAAELSNTINSLTIEGNLLKQILNSMGDGLLGFDLNQKVNLRNRTFEIMFNLEAPTEASLEASMEELKKEVSEVIDQVSLAAIKNEKTEIATVLFQEKNILITGSPIRAEDNSIVGTVLLFRDVTESIRLEQTRRDYVANVSHELRSPLTSVKGLIIPLKEGMVKDEEKKNHFYGIIYNEVERLNLLVNDLFELSRLQSRNDPFEMQVVDVLNILFDQQDKFELQAKEKNIIIDVKKSEAAVYVIGNIDRIAQVLTILIDNAIKFAEKNSVVTLSAKKKKGKAIISIHNTGSFIKQEELSLIFERFYKVDKSHAEEGAGLGLSIAKEVITRMHGNIYARSDGKKETVFSFDLESEGESEGKVIS
jgi:signal transduction histidine kinase